MRRIDSVNSGHRHLRDLGTGQFRMSRTVFRRDRATIALITALLGLLALSAVAQRPLVEGPEGVRARVLATIHQDFAEGLWAAPFASGELRGSAVLDMVIDAKGRCESVFMVQSDLPIVWKNAVKDQWYDRRFDLKLPKGRKEKVRIDLRLPPPISTNEQP
jgi:hypothetical protein